MIPKTISPIAVLIALLCLTGACKKESKPTTSAADYIANANCTGIDSSQNRYTNSVKSILDANCGSSGCHNASSAQSGVDLSTYGAAKTAFQNRPVLCSVHHGSGCQPMPQGSGQLSQSDINKLNCWARNGYLQ